MSERRLDYRVLGPVEVADADGLALGVGGPKARLLLALLLVRRNEAVTVDRLVDGIWGESPPASAVTMLHGYVSKLRKVLDQSARGGSVLETGAGGYLLRVGPDDVDAARFERLAAEGAQLVASGAVEEGRRQLRAALSLWRGPPLADLAFEPALQDEIRRLDAVHLDTLERRIDADLAAGGQAEVVAELQSLVASHPLEERLHGQLMLALDRCGRTADALGVYQRLRRRLSDELGLEPGTALATLHTAILRRDSPVGVPVVTTSAAPRERPRFSHLAIAAAAMALLLAGGVAWIASDTPSGPGSLPVTVQPNSVAVIDPTTNRVVEDFPVGLAPLGPVSDGSVVWTGSAAGHTITRIDGGSDVGAATYGIELAPWGLAATPGSLWVSSGRGPFVARVDARYGTVSRTFRVPAASLPSVLVPAGDGLWFARRSEPLRRLDSRTGRVRRSYPVITNGDALAVGFGAVWVGTAGLGGLVRVDPASGAKELVPLAHSPRSIGAGFGSIWVAAVGDDRVWRIDPHTLAVQGAIDAGDGPSAILVDPVGGSVWVASRDGGTVARIDPSTDRVIATITTGERPSGVAIADGRVWVAVQASPPSRRALRVVASIPTGGVLGLTAADGAIWAVERREGRLARIDPRTNRVAKRIWIGPGNEPAVGPGGIWVPAYESNQLILVDPVRGRPVASVKGPYFAVAAGIGSVWALTLEDPTLVRIDPKTRRVAARVQLPPGPFGVAAGAGSVWVCGGDFDHPKSGGWIWRVDARTSRVTARLAMPRLCRKVALGFGSLWATLHGALLYRIDPSTGRVAARIRTSRGGAFNQDYIAFTRDSVWVTNLNNATDAELVEIDPETDRPVARASLAKGPTGLVAAFGSVWVGHFGDARVLRFRG